MAKTIDFEQELYKAFGQVKDFTLGMRIAKRFYDMGSRAMLEEIDDELMRSFWKDYEEFSDEDREIAQGVIGTIHMWVKQQKGEQQ